MYQIILLTKNFRDFGLLAYAYISSDDWGMWGAQGQQVRGVF